MKLLPKILILILGILIISIAVLTLPLYWYTRSALEDELDKRLLSIVEIVAVQLDHELIEVLINEPALSAVKAELETKLASLLTGQIEGMALYSQAGNRLAVTGQLEPDQPQVAILLKSLSTIGGNQRNAVSEIYQLAAGEYLKAAAATVQLSNNSSAVLLAWGGAEFMTYIDQLVGSIFWVTLITILVAVSLTIVFSRSLIRPVRQLSQYAHSIRKNIYATVVNIGRKDEFGELNQSLAQMHEEIRENEQRNKQLLAGIAHEIKNPLGGMEIYTGLLKEELRESTEHKSYLDKIVKELNNLKQIVFSYLDYARPPKSELKPLALEVIVEDVHRILIPEIKQKKVLFTHTGKGEILGDENKLRRVFVNLIKNCLEVVVEKGAVAVTIESRDNSVRVEVSDDGCGIPKENLDQIFQPYFTTQDKGYGLGLAIVKSIIDEMNGTIFVESETGQGSKFILEIPKS